MENSELLVLTGNEVADLLVGKEGEILESVRQAYQLHAQGSSNLPFSTFLRFPGSSQNRIIALPAYLRQDVALAGVKWVASFPDNIQRGLERASAVMILNSATTGYPQAIIEGSIINARRTAASAALAAQVLAVQETAVRVGLIGCGLINFEIVRFLLHTYPQIERFTLFDTSKERMLFFRDRCLPLVGMREMVLADNTETVFRNAALVSLATTASTPYISDLASCSQRATLLHISLRDIAPEVILACDNVTDDRDHVLREGTSVSLAAQKSHNQEFLRCTLADILLQRAQARRDEESTVIFSPFGLGVLDLAVSSLVYRYALQQRRGTPIKQFLPPSWYQRAW